MTVRTADYLPQKINQYVPNMTYSMDVAHRAPTPVELGIPVTADADGILDGEDIAAAGSTTTFESAYSHSVMGNFGRNVTVVASGAATSTVTVRGRDYLGQPMTEVLTLNGATPVVGVKAFKYIEEIAYGLTASRTIDVGWGVRLGLPYRTKALLASFENGATATAHTLVAGAASSVTQTGTTADPRGTVSPNNAPDGSKEFAALIVADETNLHGNAHYSDLT